MLEVKLINNLKPKQINKSQKNILELAKEVLEIEASSIISLKDRINGSFLEAIEILHNCKGRVIVTGMGKSGIIGKKIAATFSSTGTPSYFLHPAESTHGDSGVLTREDVVLAISNSGETSELLQLLPLIKRFDLKLISLTGKISSTLAQKSDVTLDIAVEKEACPLGLAPTASTTATLAMGDALSICLLHKRGFSSEDFLLFHPSGSLGKGLLYKVGDLMISGEKLPIVSINDKFQNAIAEISDKKLGIAVVIDENHKTQGVLTDGDIRRILLKHHEISGLLVKDVMTPSPKIISKDDFAAKALQIMEKYSITSIVINREDGSPEGMIHIHDLLKAGVA
jgi:arabinose-5-phosphate isomerase